MSFLLIASVLELRSFGAASQAQANRARVVLSPAFLGEHIMNEQNQDECKVALGE